MCFCSAFLSGVVSLSISAHCTPLPAGARLGSLDLELTAIPIRTEVLMRSRVGMRECRTEQMVRPCRRDETIDRQITLTSWHGRRRAGVGVAPHDDLRPNLRVPVQALM